MDGTTKIYLTHVMSQVLLRKENPYSVDAPKDNTERLHKLDSKTYNDQRKEPD
jgi:hypothetical protein